VTLKWLLCGVLAAFYGLVMTAVTSKYLEVRRVRSWLPATGKIVSSQSEARTVTRHTSQPGAATESREIRNFAAVRYTFNVNGRRVEGTRIGIADDPGNFQVAEKLHLYPVGKTVTVYYDQNRPENCVLERDMPERAFQVAFLVGALFGVGGLFLIFALSGGYAHLVKLGADPRQLSSVLFVTFMSLMALRFAFVFHQQGAATFKWPSAPGKILSSGVEAVKVRVAREVIFNWIRATAFRSRTIYVYEVDGVSYQCDRISFGFQTLATFRLFVKRGAAKFAPGQPVEVYYNPAAPEQAVLRRGAEGAIIIYLTAGALILMALRLGALI
jgi:hypothetical protein